MTHPTTATHAQCLFQHVHPEHDWAYTSEGGGHMVQIGDYEARGYREWTCIGLEHQPRHRGYAKRQWLTDEIRNYKPIHRA